MNTEQLQTLRKLRSILQEGTDNDTFFELAGYVHPDIINRFCDAVDEAIEYEEKKGPAKP